MMDTQSKRPDRNEQAIDEQWRQQFPIDTEKEQVQNRRQFLKTIAAGSACMACGQMALLAAEPKQAALKIENGVTKVLEVDLDNMDQGDAFLFHYPDEHSPCIMVKLDEDEIVAYSQKCTHLACPVIPKPEEDMLYCPCHNGAFDIKTGNPLFGPPKRPLPKVHFVRDDSGIVTVTGMGG